MKSFGDFKVCTGRGSPLRVPKLVESDRNARIPCHFPPLYTSDSCSPLLTEHSCPTQLNMWVVPVLFLLFRGALSLPVTASTTIDIGVNESSNKEQNRGAIEVARLSSTSLVPSASSVPMCSVPACPVESQHPPRPVCLAITSVPCSEVVNGTWIQPPGLRTIAMPHRDSGASKSGNSAFPSFAAPEEDRPSESKVAIHERTSGYSIGTCCMLARLTVLRHEIVDSVSRR